MFFPRAVSRQKLVGVATVSLLALVALVRIVSSYSITPQAFDETCHIAAAIELLDRHTYRLDPVHPPLARIAIGLPLYLAGVRYPQLPPLDHVITYTDVGNAILYGPDAGSGLARYMRTLLLARLGVLPFFLFAAAIVFVWTRHEYGEFAGVMAAALFTTMPNILAFSSIAYTDIVAAATQLALFYAFVRWLDRPNLQSALWLGLAAGLGLASKATTAIFFPAAAAAIVLGKWVTTGSVIAARPSQLVRQVAMAAVLSGMTLWTTYGFAVGHVREAMNLSAESMPSFQHFPAPLARIGRQLILSDPLVPAPALMHGVAEAWVLNKERPPAYLLGHIKEGGWWYFFLVGVVVKSPLPVLILFAAGLVAIRFSAPLQRWRALAPALAALAVLLVTMPVKYNAGVRHVLVVFPLLCIVAGCGAAYLWQGRLLCGAGAPGRESQKTQASERRWFPRLALIALLAWQLLSTLRGGRDFLAYFNELAGSDPSKVMVAGCDLDCGQDLFRLAREFEARHISRATLAVWTSSEPRRMGLPAFDVPQPYRPVTGWFAISARALRFGNLFHDTYAPGAFDWLKAYQPVGHVGKTIWLYYLPENAADNPR